MACASERAVLEVPKERIYHLKPITFSGPCKSDLTFKVGKCMIHARNDDMRNVLFANSVFVYTAKSHVISVAIRKEAHVIFSVLHQNVSIRTWNNMNKLFRYMGQSKLQFACRTTTRIEDTGLCLITLQTSEWKAAASSTAMAGNGGLIPAKSTKLSYVIMF